MAPRAPLLYLPPRPGFSADRLWRPAAAAASSPAAPCAPVAQLDRASGFEPEGRGFESLPACHWNQALTPFERLTPTSPTWGSSLTRTESSRIRVERPVLSRVRTPRLPSRAGTFGHNPVTGHLPFAKPGSRLQGCRGFVQGARTGVMPPARGSLGPSAAQAGHLSFAGELALQVAWSLRCPSTSFPSRCSLAPARARGRADDAGPASEGERVRPARGGGRGCAAPRERGQDAR